MVVRILSPILITSLIAGGLIMAGSDGPLFPLPNIIGIFFFGLGGYLADRAHCWTNRPAPWR